MISRRKIVLAIDAADKQFSWCWNFLKRKSAHPEAERQDVLEFQIRLTRAFVKLDQAYRAIKGEQTRLISRKERYKEAWFKARMAQLSAYLKAVTEAFGMGRELGDGFAWLFYQDEAALLEEHAQHQRQLLLPPNVGGLGERFFIEKMQGFEGTLVLYHALTSFLRLGDFSFFDPTSGRITTIAELKTRHIEGDQFECTLAFVFGEGNPLGERLKQVAKSLTPTLTREPLDSTTQQKLDRQLDQITGALHKRDTDIKDNNLRADGRFHFKSLADAVERSNPRIMEFEIAGSGLLIGALRPRRIERLGQRIFRKNGNMHRPLKTLVHEINRIMRSDLPDNCLFMGNLCEHTNGFPLMLPGTIPVMWWPLPEAVLHDLLFGHVIVATFFNPAHLWRLMRDRGYTVETNKRSRVTLVTRRLRNKTVRMHNFEFFQGLVQRALVDEETVLEMIEVWLQKTSDAGGQRPSRIRLRPQIV